MKEQRLRAVARRWIEQGWQRGEARMVHEMHAPEFIDHDSAGRPPDREGFKTGLENLYAAFPDFRAEIEDLVVDVGEGKVGIRWSGTGTHRGLYLGIEPTGRVIRFKGIEIIRVVGERIVERWGEWDGLELLHQLRGLPSA